MKPEDPSSQDPLAPLEPPAEVDQKEKELKAEQRRADLRAIIRTPFGFRWFKRFFEENGLLANPYRSDAQLTAFECGQKNVALKVYVQCCEALTREELGALLFREPTKK